MTRPAARPWLLLLALAFAPVKAAAEPLPVAPAPRTLPVLVFANVTVIDVAAGKAVRGQTVVVKDERIAAVGPAAQVAVPPGATVIDGTNKFLIPGLWDMHAHIADASFTDWFLRYGVTGVRHMFAANPLFEYRKPADSRTGPVHPRVVVANQILDGPDTAFRWPVGTNVVKAADAAAARAAVAAIEKQGNDFLKVHAALPKEAYLAAVEEARLRGMMVAGHVPRSITVAEASAAGQHTVEHLSGVAVVCSALERQHLAQLRGKGVLGVGFDAATGWRIELEAHGNFNPKKAAALFETFKGKGTWHVPTLVQTRQMIYLASPEAIPADVEKQLPAFLATVWNRRVTLRDVSLPLLSIRLTWSDLKDRERLLKGDLELVRHMHEAGVGLLAGTDATAPLVVPGFSLHEELGLLVEAGLTPAEALRAATLSPARCLKMEDRLGTVEAGKFADLVLLAKNPLDNIAHTRAVEVVVVGGRVAPR